MGRAPQAFITDGYSPTTVEGSLRRRARGLDGADSRPTRACAIPTSWPARRSICATTIAKIDKPTLILAGADDPDHHAGRRRVYRTGSIRGAKLRRDRRRRPSSAATSSRPKYNAAIESFLAELKSGSRPMSLSRKTAVAGVYRASDPLRARQEHVPDHGRERARRARRRRAHDQGRRRRLHDRDRDERDGHRRASATT